MTKLIDTAEFIAQLRANRRTEQATVPRPVGQFHCANCGKEITETVWLNRGDSFLHLECVDRIDKKHMQNRMFK